MNIRSAFAALAAAWCASLLIGCVDRAEPQSTSGAARSPTVVAEAVADEVEAALNDLENDGIASSTTQCEQGLAAAARSTDPLKESVELACELAIAGATEPIRSDLELQFRALVDSNLTLELALEAAGRGDRMALLEVALQLEQRSGEPAASFTALDAETFNAARAAASRALQAGTTGAEEALERLESREFPLAGVREEPLWRALYFRRFDRIQDTIATRRHVAGLANALATLCQQWEPPGIRSVGFDAGLETYLAPVRAEVPSRLVDAVPKVAGTISTAVGNATDGASRRTLAGWIEQSVRAYQDVKRDVHGALAVGSVVGRDAAQALFEAAPGCRSPRGLKFIESLIRYFDFARESRPTDAPTTQRPSGRVERSGSTFKGEQ